MAVAAVFPDNAHSNEFHLHKFTPTGAAVFDHTNEAFKKEYWSGCRLLHIDLIVCFLFKTALVNQP